jgi:transcriptional regulator GlxA family with amidase domain
MVKEHLGHLVDLQLLDEQRSREFLARAPVLSPADSQNRATENANHRQVPIADILRRLQTGDPPATSRSMGSERPAVRIAREYMESHFSENVTIPKLAALVSLSPYYFARAFEREIGLPPHAYLETVRIRKAREFLDRGCTVVSAALSAGYVDQSHFTHRFNSFSESPRASMSRRARFDKTARSTQRHHD